MQSPHEINAACPFLGSFMLGLSCLSNLWVLVVPVDSHFQLMLLLSESMT
jgi:hypothetical protein